MINVTAFGLERPGMPCFDIDLCLALTAPFIDATRDHLMSKAAALLILLVSCLAQASKADAYGTIRRLGQDAEHEKITRLALTGQGMGQRTMDELAGKNNTFGAVGAPDNPVRGLMSKQEAHCDGADYMPIDGYAQTETQALKKLESCREWIFRWLDEAVADAAALVDADGSIRASQTSMLVPCIYNGTKGRAKCNVLESLGLAFHASQDFYSHSNWSDIPRDNPITQLNPPGLANTEIAPWIDPRRSLPTTSTPITGCYEGFPEAFHCNDGPGGRVKHEFLNKDFGAISLDTASIAQARTERGRMNDNFGRSVRLAIVDTRDKWLYAKQRIVAIYGNKANRILCAILQDNPSDALCPP